MTNNIDMSSTDKYSADKINEAALRQQLVDQYKHVESIGLNELASGNLSCRYGNDMLISPAGATADNINPEAIVLVTEEGKWEECFRPSSEWQMHAAIYREHKNAQAVVHTHSDHCVALACHTMALPGFHYLVGTFGGIDVPCVPYSTFGTERLGENAAEALRDRTACLLGSHGMICRGQDLVEAVHLAHRLEIMCRQYLLTRQLGEPHLLTNEEWDGFFDRASTENYGI